MLPEANQGDGGTCQIWQVVMKNSRWIQADFCEIITSYYSILVK
jgi:hypothetical protein